MASSKIAAFLWLCINLSFLTVSQRAFAQSACEFEDFRRPIDTPDRINEKFQDAVFPIKAGSEFGTGYLIDAERGYAMTAGHVVKDIIENGSGSIKAHGPIFGTAGASLNLVDSDLSGNADFAILRFVDLNLVKNIVALDISSRLPKYQEEFTTLSWGQEPDATEPQSGTPKYSRNLGNGVMEFSEQSTGVDRGDSGSPLIDATGLVIGTLVGRRSVVKSEYVSVRLARNALMSLGAADKIEKLSAAVTSGKVTQEVLLARMLPTRGDLTNFDLATWVGLILQSKSQYQKRANLFPCPILPAFIGRDLSRFAIEISGFGPIHSVDIGRSMLKEAQLDAMVADFPNAIAGLDAANKLLSTAISNYELSHPKSVGLASCWADLSTNQSNEVCSGLSGDIVLAGLYRDKSLALYGISKIAEIGQDDRLNESRNSIQMALLLTNDPTSLGISYSVLGDVMLRLGQPEGATGAYAAAYDEGARFDWLIANFEHSARLVQDDLLAKQLKETGIDGAPRIMAIDVYMETVEQ